MNTVLFSFVLLLSKVKSIGLILIAFNLLGILKIGKCSAQTGNLRSTQLLTRS